jgi:hypothetical protein
MVIFFLTEATMTAHLPAIPEGNTERAAFWASHIEDLLQSNLSHRAYAEQHGLPLARLTYWKQKLRPRPRSTAFVRASVEATSPVRIHHRSGAVIECLPGTDVAWLKQLLGMPDAP